MNVSSTHRSCPLCAGPSPAWLAVAGDFHRPQVRQSYQLYWCAACQYGFLDPRPAVADVAAFYPSGYYTHQAVTPTPGKLEKPPFSSRLLCNLAWRFDRGSDLLGGHLRNYLAGSPRVCDVGCGSGILLSRLRDAGCKVQGVEIDPVAREVARGKNLEVFAGLAEELPGEVEPGSYDIVVMSHVLEHCVDPLLALKNVSGLLRPSGILVVEVPNNESQGLADAGSAWPWLDVPRHLNFFSASSLVASCRRFDLQEEKVEFVGFVRQFLPSWIESVAKHRRYLEELDGIRRTGPSPWSFLTRTAMAPPERKYDSVRVVARRSA